MTQLVLPDGDALDRKTQVNDWRSARRRAVLCLAVLCVLLFTACSRNPEVRKRKYYDRAMELTAKGNLPQAALELRNALQTDPKFVEAANVLASIDARQGNYREAYSLLLAAERTNPDYLPVRKGLSQFYRSTGKLPEAQNELEYVLEHNPEDTDALLQLGDLQLSQKRFTDAEGSFNRILEIQPSHVQALLALASLKRQARDLPGAEQYLKLALARNPRSTAVYLNLLKFYIANRRPEAEPLFSQALKVSNNGLEILEAQDGYYEGLGRLPEAEGVVRRIQALHANDARYWGALADFYLRTGNLPQAKAELERVFEQHKADTVTLHKLIDLDLNLNEGKTAETLNGALLKKNPKDAYAHLFQGRIYLGAGKSDEALVEFNKTREYQADFAALYYWYAIAYLQRREVRLAKQSLETAVKCDPTYRVARLELARLQNQTGTADVAMANAKTLLLENPGDVEAMLVYSEALLLKQRTLEAEKLVKEVATRAPGSSEAHRQLGLLYLSRKNLPAAEKEFKTAWDLQPDSRLLLEALLKSYQAEKQTSKASGFLTREIQEHPNNSLLYYELAQIDLVLGKRNDAISALQRALSLAPSNPGSALLLAETYAAANQPEPAVQLVDGLVRKYPQDPEVILRAGMVFEKAQRWEDAIRAYQRVVQLDSDDARAKNNLAWLLASHGGDIDAALALAQQAKEKLADNPQVTDTIGWIYYQKKLYKTALDYLKQCVAQDQKNPTFVYQLGMTYWQLGQKAEARRAILKSLALDPQFAEAASARDLLGSL